MTMEGQAPNLEELQNNLKHQLALYRQLVDLLREEKEHIIAVRFKEIREATYAKEAILDEVQREEFRRSKWTSEAAKFLKVSEKDITMEMVATQIGGPALFEGLMSLKNALAHMLKKAKEMNLENKALVETALNDTQIMKRNILGLTSDKPQTYGPKGNMGGAGREQGARILSKEA